MSAPFEVPEQYRQALAQHRAVLGDLATRAADADRSTLRTLAAEILEHLAAGDRSIGGHLRWNVRDIVESLDAVYDRVFPVTDPTDPADLLDVPWPVPARRELLAKLVEDRWFRPEPLAERAVAAGDVRLLHLILDNPFQSLTPHVARQVLDALYAAGALDVPTVQRALRQHRYLWTAVASTDPAGCSSFVRDVLDEVVWRGDWPADRRSELGRPRGLRFVLRALDPGPAGPAGSAGSAGSDRDTVILLGGAELTDAERLELVSWLAARPRETAVDAFRLRLPAGDAEMILPVLGLETAIPLFRICRIAAVETRGEGHGPHRYDVSEIRDAAERAGDDGTRALLTLTPSEAVGAALGTNRAAVEKRVKHNALDGIAAYGLLPLTDGETVSQRYAHLREVAKRGAKLGPNRRHSHAAAIDVALDHLAQVAGFADAGLLERFCEAGIAQETAELRVGPYTATVRADGADAVIEVVKAGRPLKSVPAEVRRDPGYADLRERQERLRDQARRLRTGFLERLVATGGTVTPVELEDLLRLPSGAAMLPDLLWLDEHGTLGMLADVDVATTLTAVHPFHLFERGLLAQWQAEIVHRRVRQPVKQAFRELYLLTPAEREAVTSSARFAGHRVDGKVAGQLLSARGWTIRDSYDDPQVAKPAGPGLTAALRCDYHGYFGRGDVLFGDVALLRDKAPAPLESAHPVVFSELMRDLDLVVSVAGTDPDGYASPLQAESRAQLLGVLIRTLGLANVDVEGVTAVVRGSRARYRVHLNSGSIHVEPGGYLCVVPRSFGATRHGRLFLPFADDDRVTSVVLSKVLLLAEDEKITDESILAQLRALERQ